jgi:glycosyltransferase involved in cell wall biosynthesis
MSNSTGDKPATLIEEKTATEVAPFLAAPDGRDRARKDAAFPTLSVVIPAYNEAATIARVLERVQAVPLVSQIVVVDDCSKDETPRILNAFVAGVPDAARLRVVRHAANRGKGASIVTGLRYATGDVVIVQDADLEYEPEQFADLLAVIVHERANVVYGSRFRGAIEGMRLPNLIANRVLTLLANVLFNARITDEATCYKMFRREVLGNITLRSRRFDFCPEFTAKVRKRGYKIHEVPIRYHGRTQAEGKKIGWKDGLEAVWALIKYRFVD